MARRATILAFALVLFGCRLFANNDEDTGAGAPPAPPPAPAPTVNAASGEVTGIPECDALLVAFECYMKNSGVPDYQKSIQAMRDGFRQSASNPAGRGTTTAACKMQMNVQQANFARVGCSGAAGGSGNAGSPAMPAPGAGNLQ